MPRIPELPLEPPQEAPPARQCAWCGDEIYRGDFAFEGEAGTLHAQCIKDMVLVNFSDDDIAELLGYKAVVV